MIRSIRLALTFGAIPILAALGTLAGDYWEFTFPRPSRLWSRSRTLPSFQDWSCLWE